MRRKALAAAAGLALVNRAVVNRERKPAEPDGGRIVGRLHVLEEGRPDADPLVLLHGFAGSMRWFDRLAPLLAPEHRVIRVDLLGHGGSEKPADGYELENQARLVATVLDELGVDRAVVLGHSFGGAVGTALAAQRSELVRALAVVDEGPDESFGSTPLLTQIGFVPVLGEILHRVVPDALVRDGYADAFAKDFDLSGSFAEQVVRDFRRMTYTSYKASWSAEQRFLSADPIDARLRRLALPALVVFGEHDRFFRAADCAAAFEAIPGVRVLVLPGLGHSPIVEAPERIAAPLAELCSATS